MSEGTWDPSKGITFAATEEPHVWLPNKRIVFAGKVGSALTSFHEQSCRQKLTGCVQSSARRAASVNGKSYHTITPPTRSSSSLLSKPFPIYHRPAGQRLRPVSKKKVELQLVKESKSKAASKQPAPNSTQSGQRRGEPAAPLNDCAVLKSTISRPRSANVKNTSTNKPCYKAEATASSSTCYIEPEVDRRDLKTTQSSGISDLSKLVKCFHPSQIIDKPSDPGILTSDVIQKAAKHRQRGIEKTVDLLWVRQERNILEQYRLMKILFERTKMGWTDLKKCFRSACNLGDPRPVTVCMKILAGEIELIQEEFRVTSHHFRMFYLFRLYMDQCNWMTPEGQYIMLRDIRMQMLTEPFQLCQDSNKMIYDFLLKYGKVLPKSKTFRSEGFEKLRSLVTRSHKELRLSIQDRLRLCNQLFEPQIDAHCHAASLNRMILTSQCAAMKLALFEAEERMATTWKYMAKTEYVTKQSRFDPIGKMLYCICEELRSISELYVKLVVKNSINNHLCWRAPKDRQSLISRAGCLSTTQTTSIKPMASSSIEDPIVAAPYITSDIANIGQSLEDPCDPASDSGTLPVGALKVPAEDSHVIAQAHNQLSVNHSRYNNHQCIEVRPIIDQISHIPSFIEEISDQCTYQQPRAFMSYQIPDSKLGEAMLASRSTAAAYWRYSLFENETGEKVQVHYCKSKETTEGIAQLFLDKEVIGFDIEWKPQAQTTDGIRKNVSLIQIASEERIALFHVARYAVGDTIDDLLAPTLKQIMESDAITKVGVAIKSDCTRLRKFLGINAQSIFELSHLYKLVKYSADDVKKIDKKLVGLSRQVEEHLQLPLCKGEVRFSDWSQELNPEQIQYAASDSYAGFHLYHMLERKRKLLKPTPPRPEHAELNLPIRLADGQTVTTAEDLQGTNEGVADDIELPAISIDEVARDLIDISLEDDESKQKPNEHNRPTKNLLKAPEVAMADEWVREWRSTRSPDNQVQAIPAYLRAYSLWHHQEYNVVEAARLLRNPPLQTSTVCGYILEAIRIERLPFEAERLRSVLGLRPELAMRRKYQGLRRQIG